MRERILKAAMEKIEAQGLRGFTMDDVARSIGISKKTLYQHYESKNDLIEAAVDKWVETEMNLTNEAMDSSGNWLERMKAAMDVHSHPHLPIRLLEEVHSYYPALESKIDGLRLFKENLHRQILASGVESGQVREELNIDVYLLLVDRIVLNLVEKANSQNKNLSLSQIVDTLGELLFFGVLKENSDLRK